MGNETTSGSYFRVISGVDMTAAFTFPHLGVGCVFATVKTLTYSTFREKFPVRLLGRTRAAGHTRGPRTIAGTLVFSVIYQDALEKVLMQAAKADRYKASLPGFVLMDELPPFNITALFINEIPSSQAGSIDLIGGAPVAESQPEHNAILRIYNAEIATDASEFSIDSLTVEKVMQYTATDIQVLHTDGMWGSREPSISPAGGEPVFHPIDDGWV